MKRKSDGAHKILIIENTWCIPSDDFCIVNDFVDIALNENDK